MESRTLLATTPAATATSAAVNLSGLSSVSTDGNANSPAVVIDPYDSQKLFAVWGVDLSSLSPVPHTTAVVEGAYSTNGGTSWTGLGQEVASPQRDVATINATPPTDYTEVTDPSVAFDGQGNVYVLTLQTTGAADGELYLTRFNFSGSAPSQEPLPNNGIVYQWVAGSDGVTDPAMAVDTSPSDPHANNVYITWASIDTEPANPDPYAAQGFNPNRAELVVGTPIANPSVDEQSLAFSAVTTVSVNGNFGPNDNSHLQLVINQNDNGQITVAWDDFGTGSKALPAYDVLNSSLVQAGDTYGFTNSIGTGIILPGTSNESPGNWATPVIYSAGLATSTNPAEPVGIATEVTVNGGTTDVNGDGKDDVVVADQGTGQIGVLLNSGTGALQATSVYSAVSNPSGVSLGDFISGHTTANILDAATSNGAPSGGVSVNPNGTPPTDGLGVFKSAVPLQSVPGGSAETAIVTADVDGNGIPNIVAADPGKGTIDIWLNPSSGTSAPISLSLPGGDIPVAVVVDKFRGPTSNPDIAVLNSNGKIVIFQNGITAGNLVVPEDFTPYTVATVADAVSMTSGQVDGNVNLPDLIVTRDDPGQNELMVVPNSSSSSSLSFGTPTAVANSIFAGTPVGGEQGLATGQLSTSGNYSSYKDIAVVYAAFGTGESMVAVFQNLKNGQFSRTFATGGEDFDAGQENPTAIALLHLTNSTTLPFEDIVVTNNDNFDRTTFAGTVSVLQPAATPTITQGTPSTFNDSVDVPDPLRSHQPDGHGRPDRSAKRRQSESCPGGPFRWR
ncbi:MAG: VCBS repeat-containing protein [Isosphaeraceae bacterium]